MPIPSNPDDSLFTAALADDEELKAEIRSLMRLAINQSRRLMMHGSESTKINAIRNLMPSMVKALSVKADTENEAIAELKRMIAEMNHKP